MEINRITKRYLPNQIRLLITRDQWSLEKDNAFSIEIKVVNKTWIKNTFQHLHVWYIFINSDKKWSESVNVSDPNQPWSELTNEFVCLMVWINSNLCVFQGTKLRWSFYHHCLTWRKRSGLNSDNWELN